jgi:hypothetical protein
MPGRYTVRLTVNGQTYSQPLTVKMDPRTPTPLAGLQQQFTVTKQMYDDGVRAQQALKDLDAIRVNLWRITDQAVKTPAGPALLAFDSEGGFARRRIPRNLGPGGHNSGPNDPPTLNSALAGLAEVIPELQQADVLPSTQLVAAAAARRQIVAGVMSRWAELKGAPLADLNAQLQQAGLPAVSAGPASR